ncbi:MAG: anaerobic ribonucleoside-triphosphate reductase activating protein [Clostridia bacterium]|nr:anaerobic ribonucleoside-triphosphate reductase activating protein [Clostridia bacterium]
MYYGAIKRLDVANGIGVRVSLFVSGCTNHCEHCFQPETWDFCYGQPYTMAVEAQIIEALRPSYVRGLTILGGEPFEPENQRSLLPLLKNVRRTLPNKDIWCYTGFRLEDELLTSGYARCEVTDDMLALIDVLVDGRYVEALKDASLAFRGSSNQRILDVPATLREGRAILWQDPT